MGDTRLTMWTGMQGDQDSLRRKNEELIQSFREKNRKQLQTQELYDKLKRRAMLGQVQDAASDAVYHTIQASVAANRFVDRVGNQNQRPPQPPLFPNQQTGGKQRPHTIPENWSNVGAQMGRSDNGDGNRAGFSSQESVHRRILPSPLVSTKANSGIRKPAYSNTFNSSTAPSSWKWTSSPHGSC
jgi:E3 ubiquitin-protein ligase CCNP1IP1